MMGERFGRFVWDHCGKIFFVLLALYVANAYWMVRRSEERPCESFANEKLSDVPARCVPFFAGDGGAR